MALVEQEVSLKVLYPGLVPKVFTVQSDTGRTVRCTIEDWTIPSEATATVYALKPSKSLCYNTCTVDTSTNSVLVTLTNQMLAEAGTTAAMVEITSGGEIVTAFRFAIVNHSKIAGGTESTNESTALEEMFAALQEEIEASLASNTKATNLAVSTANTAAVAATEAASAANAAAEAANEAVEVVGDLTEYVNDIIFSINDDDLGLDITINK